MDLEFLTPPCVSVSLSLTNLNTFFYVGPLRRGGRFDFKGNPCQDINPLQPDYPRHHHRPSQSQQLPSWALTASNIPIKLLSFIGIPARSLNSFSPSHILTGSYVFVFFFISSFHCCCKRFSCYGSV